LSLAAFELAEVGAINAGKQCECILGDAALLSPFAENCAASFRHYRIERI